MSSVAASGVADTSASASVSLLITDSLSTAFAGLKLSGRGYCSSDVESRKGRASRFPQAFGGWVSLGISSRSSAAVVGEYYSGLTTATSKIIITSDRATIGSPGTARE